MRSHHFATALVLGLLAPSPSAAQRQDDKAAAELLFDNARKLVRESKFAEACPMFAESQRLDPGVGTILHLADCFERDGKAASAWAAFREASDLARAAGQHDRVKIAADRASALEKLITRIRVVLAPGADVPGVEVLRDGRPIGRLLLAAGVPVDPGKHEITARAPGKVEWSSIITANTPGELVVTVPAFEAAPAASSAVVIPPPPPSAPPSAPPSPATAELPPPVEPPRFERDSRYRTAAVVLGGAGIVSLGAATFLSFSAKARYGDKDAHCGAQGCTDEGIRIAEQARSRANLATVFVGAAVIMAGASAGLYWGAPERRVGVVAVVGPQAAGISVGGTL